MGEIALNIMTTTKTIIRVNFIGRIWMPAVICGHSLILTDRDNQQFTEPWDLSEDSQALEFVEHCLTTRTGDFQSVTDFEAVREITVTSDNQNSAKRFIHAKSEFTTLKAWTSEENEMAYCDCVCSE